MALCSQWSWSWPPQSASKEAVYDCQRRSAQAVVDVLSTSLRLAARVDGLPERQEDRSERLMGPPARIAFADDGSPTKAAEGFARKAGVSVDDLEAEATHEMISSGAELPAYPAIVGAAQNGIIWHYNRNGKRLENGETTQL